MDQRSIKCRICKKDTTQKVVHVADNLPPYVEVLECLSCGALGVMNFKQPDNA